MEVLQEHVAAGKRNILVKAPVKSGKRELVEYIAVRNPEARVKYVTSLDRRDVQEQKKELQKYSIETHLTKGEDAVSAAISDIDCVIKSQRVPMTCFDECDYGSGNNQKLARLYAHFLNNDKVVKLYFSATEHETAASNLNTREDFVAIEYVPPPEYCGAGYFLREGLVFKPAPFFENDGGTINVSPHGRKVVQESFIDGRHIGVVRVPRKIPTSLFKDGHVRAALEQNLTAMLPDGKSWKIVPIDEKSPHDWENPELTRGYVSSPDKNYLFLIKMTCTRGTDLKGWHHKLAFWHDQREKEKVNLNTLIQALMRPAHYSTSYGGIPQRIRMYVEKAVVEMAHHDDMAKYLLAGGKAPTRTVASRDKSGWAVPIRVIVSDDVLSDERIGKNASTDGVREWISAVVLSLLSREHRDKIAGRTLKNKRTYGVDNQVSINKVHNAYTDGRGSRPGGGIHTVHKAAEEKRGSGPGGGMTEGVDAVRSQHFWLDIAKSDIGDIQKGAVYITYGLKDDDDDSSAVSSAAPSPKVRATKGSMFESRK